MKKLVICTVPMKEREPRIYKSIDISIPAAEKAVVFPVNEFLEMTIQPDDEIKVLLLIKESANGSTSGSIERFKRELTEANVKAQAQIKIVEINTEFSQEKMVHEELLLRIIDEISVGDHIICDMTYGPKDMPIVMFTACNFAENHLDCEVDNILYGQAEFDDNNKAINTKLCDMSPLYYLNSVTNTIVSNNPEKAKDMFKKLIKM